MGGGVCGRMFSDYFLLICQAPVILFQDNWKCLVSFHLLVKTPRNPLSFQISSLPLSLWYALLKNWIIFLGKYSFKRKKNNRKTLLDAQCAVLWCFQIIFSLFVGHQCSYFRTVRNALLSKVSFGRNSSKSLQCSDLKTSSVVLICLVK